MFFCFKLKYDYTIISFVLSIPETQTYTPCSPNHGLFFILILYSSMFWCDLWSFNGSIPFPFTVPLSSPYYYLFCTLHHLSYFSSILKSLTEALKIYISIYTYTNLTHLSNCPNIFFIYVRKYEMFVFTINCRFLIYSDYFHLNDLSEHFIFHVYLYMNNITFHKCTFLSSVHMKYEAVSISWILWLDQEPS